MEVAPILIAAPVLIATWRRFPLTPLLYMLIALHALILIFGGAYAYARVPLGYWLQDWLALDRNPYDRIGHLMQGLTPALVCARDFPARRLRRGTPDNRVPLRLRSADGERVLRAHRMAGGARAGAGRRRLPRHAGDPWDTQNDMFCALIGAILALALLSRVQDVQIRALQSRPVRPL